jgi:hypothetical protein
MIRAGRYYDVGLPDNSAYIDLDRIGSDGTTLALQAIGKERLYM